MIPGLIFGAAFVGLLAMLGVQSLIWATVFTLIAVCLFAGHGHD
jgi:hypothetical protein